MSGALLRWAGIGLAAALAYGCVVAGGGGGYEGGPPPYGLDYYGPPGVVYGGWGRGYEVAPFRDRDHERHAEVRERGPAPHAFRPAPASRPIPSIPTGPRFGGGARGGGEHGGGHR